MKLLTFIYLIVTLSHAAAGQTEVKKVHYLDDEFVTTYVKAFYVGCEKKVVDTVYSLKFELQSQGEWQVFYDTDFDILHSEYYTRNDTAFAIKYYPNGQKKAEERHVEIYYWVYSGKWCENGQVVSTGQPNDPNYRTETTFYCNGNRKWEGNLYHGRIYGKETRWYENGQKQSEKKYSEFNQELADNGELESNLISENYWDEEGNETEPFFNEIININTLGAPIKISESERTEVAYHSISGQEYYDATMSAFKEKVYEVAQLQTECICKVGIVYVSFTVTQNGDIIDVRLDDGLESCADQAFLEAIANIGQWTPALVDDEAVDTRVIVSLELERIKR